MIDKLMAAVERWGKIQSDAMRTEEGVAFLRRILNNFADATRDEQGRFHSIIIEMLGAYESILDLHSRNMIDPGTFKAIEGSLIGFLKTPGGLQYWEFLAQNLPAHLSQRIGRALAEPEIRPFTETWSVMRMDPVPES